MDIESEPGSQPSRLKIAISSIAPKVRQRLAAGGPSWKMTNAKCRNEGLRIRHERLQKPVTHNWLPMNQRQCIIRLSIRNSQKWYLSWLPMTFGDYLPEWVGLPAFDQIRFFIIFKPIKEFLAFHSNNRKIRQKFKYNICNIIEKLKYLD